MAESSAARKPRRQGIKVSGDAGPAPKLPRQARALNQRIASVPEGHEISQAIIRGESIKSIEARFGLTREQLFTKVTAFQTLAPEAYRQMADGLRTFLANLAIDDILHWRPKSRDALDLEEAKLGLTAYKDAKDTLIKVFGLQSQTVDIAASSRQTPHSMEEIAAHIRENPEMAAAVEELHRLASAKPAA